MNNKIIIVIATVIAIMVSIIAYIQILPFIHEWQKERARMEDAKIYNECIDKAKAEAGPDEYMNESRYRECYMGEYDQ